jgi:phospholipid/cholesterol/gamma-HCH transport system substrate-binding protein
MDPRDKKSEEIKVGTVIAVAAVLFLTALIFVGGVNLFRKKKATYNTYLKFAGGLEPGSVVRFGGLKVGTIRAARIDARDSTRIQVTFQVDRRTPIRTNSKARVSSLGLLGENYLEVSAGTRDAPLLLPGGEVPAVETAELVDVINNVNSVTVGANKLVNDLDGRLLALADHVNQVINNVQAVAGPENRRHIASALANADTMLANFETASEKLSPTLENVNATVSRANVLVDNFNTIALENRASIRTALLSLRDTLHDARRVMADVDDVLVGNRDNLDETLQNIRISSQNLRQFTDTIKRRPFSLIRIKAESDHVPPTGK